MTKKKTILAFIIVAVFTYGCIDMQSAYEYEPPPTQARKCFSKYIKGELISETCHKAIRYGQ